MGARLRTTGVSGRFQASRAPCVPLPQPPARRTAARSPPASACSGRTSSGGAGARCTGVASRSTVRSVDAATKASSASSNRTWVEGAVAGAGTADGAGAGTGRAGPVLPPRE